MRLKLPTLSLLLSGAAIIASMVLASCSTDQIEIPKDELFTREFIKQFGVPDPDHDWNQSHRATVTVTTAKPTQVKIYADVKGSRYLFGTFLGVNGSQQLGVDIPKGVDKLIVRANGISHTVTPGSALNIASRAAETTPTVTATLGARENWKTFSAEEILSYRTKLPEEVVNIDEVTDNFTFVPKENFIIYPVFFQTGNAPEIGIYYRPNNTTDQKEFVRIPIYYAKDNVVIQNTSNESSSTSNVSNQILQMCMDVNEWIPVDKQDDFKSMTDELWKTYRIQNAPETTDTYEYLWWEYAQPGNWPTGVKDAVIEKYKNTEPFKSSEDMSLSYPLVHQLAWQEPGDDNDYRLSYNERAEAWRSKGIIINITPGQQYGFYMASSGGDLFYSETEFNETLEITGDFKQRDDMSDEEFAAMKEKYSGKPIPHFGIYETIGANNEPRYVVGCEDWYKWGDYDLNDAIFFVENINPTDDWPPFETEDIDVPSYEWVVAAEDLGNTDDFDFNDVVFGVSKYQEDEKGKATVSIRALAAGGTLPVYLNYTNQAGVTTQIGDEFHTWFRGVTSSNQVVNAGSKADKVGNSITIEVDKGFAMSCCQRDPEETSNMGGFTIRVVNPNAPGGEVTEITAPNLETNAQNYAPQMICVPTEWLWPTERTHINNAYTRFKDWVVKQTSCPDWHDECITENVTKRDIPFNKKKPTDGGWGYTPGTEPGGSTTPTTQGIALEQTGEDIVDNTTIMRKYSLANVVNELASATKVTFYVNRSIATHFYCCNNPNWGNPVYFQTSNDSSQPTEFELSDTQIQDLKSRSSSSDNFITMHYYGINSKDGFNPSVSIKIE